MKYYWIRYKFCHGNGFSPAYINYSTVIDRHPFIFKNEEEEKRKDEYGFSHISIQDWKEITEEEFNIFKKK